MEQEHKRRVRYNGTHPHSFQEKYKELNPESYKGDVEKIIQNGKTPAGMHLPICVNEILEFFQIKQNQIGLDATLGYGGHTQKMLEKLDSKGHIYAIDVDPIELEKTKKRLESLGYGNILSVSKMNFADIDRVAPNEKFDFVIADLGVSSMQIDNPERGFTFKRDGKLDLRLDPTSGISAADFLRQLSYCELIAILQENSDEPYAEQIAKAVMRAYNSGELIETTRQLYCVICAALSFLPKLEQSETIKKSCQRVFQALRIEVNSEFEVLNAFLEKLPNVLKSGGKVAILSFHSGEDRLIKKAFKTQQLQGLYSEIARDVIRPSSEECILNPRAHSTKMRWAIRA